jgi:hypothetical protein
MSYTEKLATPDDITVMTYHKGGNIFNTPIKLLNVYVASIDVPGGTVNARIGEAANYIDYPKAMLFGYINLCCFSSTGS